MIYLKSNINLLLMALILLVSNHSHAKLVFYKEIKQLDKSQQNKILTLIQNTVLYLEKLEELEEVTSIEKSNNFPTILSMAWANDKINCLYGTWPSSSVEMSNGKKICDRPHRQNNLYKEHFKDKCNKMLGLACNPALFGEEALCISLDSTLAVRNSSAACFEAFRESGRSIDSILDNLNQKPYLQQLLDQTIDTVNKQCQEKKVHFICESLAKQVDEIVKRKSKDSKIQLIEQTNSPVVKSEVSLVKQVEKINSEIIDNSSSHKKCDKCSDLKVLHSILEARDEQFEVADKFCEPGEDGHMYRKRNVLLDQPISANDNANFTSTTTIDKDSQKEVRTTKFSFTRNSLSNNAIDSYQDGVKTEELIGHQRVWDLSNYANGNISSLTLMDYPVETEKDKQGKIMSQYLGNPPKTKEYTFFPRLFKPKVVIDANSKDTIKYYLSNGEFIDLSLTSGKITAGPFKEIESNQLNNQWCRNSGPGLTCNRQYSQASVAYEGNAVYIESDQKFNHIPCETYEPKEQFAKRYRVWMEKYREIILSGQYPPESSPERICLKWRKIKFINGKCVNERKAKNQSTNICYCSNIEARELYNRTNGGCYQLPSSDKDIDELVKKKCGFSLYP